MEQQFRSRTSCGGTKQEGRFWRGTGENVLVLCYKDGFLYKGPHVFSTLIPISLFSRTHIPAHPVSENYTRQDCVCEPFSLYHSPPAPLSTCKMHLKSALLSLFLLGSTAVNGQSSAPNLTSVLSSNSELSALATLLTSKPDLVEFILNWPYDITILAPDNEAFEEFTKRNNTSQDSVPNDGNSTDVIDSLLRYHILNGTYYARDIVEGKTSVAWTLLANNSLANLNDNQSQVVFARREDGNDDDDISFYSGLNREADVERANIVFNKGVIHIIEE